MMRLAGILLFLLLGLASCAREVPVLGGSTMGTTYSVIVPGLSATHKESLKSRVDLILAQINSALSTYQSDSSIAKFNASISTDWMVVPGEFAVVADTAIQIAADSGGAFDPTIASLIGLWGFGPETLSSQSPASLTPASPTLASPTLASPTPASPTPALPDASEISLLLQQSGYCLLYTSDAADE